MTEKELNERKKAIGLTSEQVAELSGVPLGTVQKIFSGQTRSPRYDTMQKIERVLNGGSPKDMLRESAAEYRSGKDRKEGKGCCTLEDFHALPEGTRAELLNGVIYVMEAPGTAHQVIALQIGHMLEAHIDADGGSCVPFLAPVDVRFSEDSKEVLEPDLVMVCDRSKIHKKEIIGAPDLVVEILSPSNTVRQMILKKNRYLKNGVREYWEIDPDDESIMVMVKEPDPENGTQEMCGSYPEIKYTTRIYSFADRVPVSVWGGACKIDFPKIVRRLKNISVY